MRRSASWLSTFHAEYNGWLLSLWSCLLTAVVGRNCLVTLASHWMAGDADADWWRCRHGTRSWSESAPQVRHFLLTAHWPHYTLDNIWLNIQERNKEILTYHPWMPFCMEFLVASIFLCGIPPFYVLIIFDYYELCSSYKIPANIFCPPRLVSHPSLLWRYWALGSGWSSSQSEVSWQGRPGTRALYQPKYSRRNPKQCIGKQVTGLYGGDWCEA